jgi:hypothetical protein
METLQEYRHIVDKKTKEIFINSLKKVLKKFHFKELGFIGVIGSLKEEYSHDIDILIFPSENAKIGEAIMSVVDFYNKLEKELKKCHERFYLVCSPKKAIQETDYYLASLQEGSAGLIPVHSLFFPDYKSFKKFNPKDFQKEIKKNLITLYGNFDVIKKIKNNIHQRKLEPYFFILDFEMVSKLKVFPKHLVRAKAESLFSYLKLKYGIEIKKKKFHNLNDIEKELFEILKKLDNEVYNFGVAGHKIINL